jgi:hypothetical protein
MANVAEVDKMVNQAKNCWKTISPRTCILTLLLLFPVLSSCDLKNDQTPNLSADPVTGTPIKTETTNSPKFQQSATYAALYAPFVLSDSPYPAPYPPPGLSSSPYPLPERMTPALLAPVPPPPLEYDLVYMKAIGPNDYELIYWNSQTGTKILVTESEGKLLNQDEFSLEGSVSSYSITPDRKHMAVLRVVRKGWILVNEFVHFNLQNKQINPLVEFDKDILHSAISPNGSSIAYLLDDKLYYFPIDNPNHSIELGDCEGYCINFAWSPDGNFIAASNDKGIWISDFYNNTTKLLISDRMIRVRDEKRLTFSSQPWSTDSRFLLIWEPDYEDGEWYVIDIQNNKSAQIPNSNKFILDSSRIIWLNDGRLCVIRAGVIDENQPASIEIWRIEPDSDEMLVLDQTITIPVSPDLYLTSPVQFEDGRIGLVLVNTDPSNSSEESGFYIIGSDGSVSKFGEVTFQDYMLNQVNATWVPDGSGVISDPGEDFISINTDASLLEIEPNSCCFTWIK